MVYVPGIFSLQARTQKATKDDGSASDATVFVAFAAKDLAANQSGTVSWVNVSIYTMGHSEWNAIFHLTVK